MENRIRPEILDELLAGASTQEEVFGPEGLLKRLTGALVERALKSELGAHLEAQERDPDAPRNRRNGSSRKTLQTDHGPVQIQVPRDRESTFEPQILPKHATRIPGLDDKIVALYSRGLSTRDIQAQLADLYGADVSPTLISQVTNAVHEEVSEWQGRPLERAYAVLWLDALVVKMRTDGVVQNRSVYVAIGLTTAGVKQVLGLWVDGSEGAKFWMKVLTDLRVRGVQDVLIACCDGLKGFPAAIEAVFPKTTVQTCIVHQVRHSLSFVSWQNRRSVIQSLRRIYTAENATVASEHLDEFERDWGGRYPMIVRSWRANWDQLTAFLAFPPEVRRLVSTTNMIESLNYQLRKVIKSKGHFPSEEATLKLLYLALRNIERRWVATPKYWSHARAQLAVCFGVERMSN